MLSFLMFYIIATKWEEYLRGHLNAADNNSSSPPPLNSVRCSSSKVFLWFYMCAFTLLICTVCLVPLLFMSKCAFKGNKDLSRRNDFFPFLHKVQIRLGLRVVALLYYTFSNTLIYGPSMFIVNSYF